MVVLCRDVSSTALSSLPLHILPGLKKLIAESTFQLKELPPLELFARLHQANLTYPSHCCAFHNVRRNRYLLAPPPPEVVPPAATNSSSVLWQVQVELLVFGAWSSEEPALLQGLLHQLQRRQLHPHPG